MASRKIVFAWDFLCGHGGRADFFCSAIGADESFCSAIGADRLFLGGAQKSPPLRGHESPRFREGLVHSTQVEVGSEFQEVVFRVGERGNDPQSEFFGVVPKKVPFF